MNMKFTNKIFSLSQQRKFFRLERMARSPLCKIPPNWWDVVGIRDPRETAVGQVNALRTEHQKGPEASQVFATRWNTKPQAKSSSAASRETVIMATLEDSDGEGPPKLTPQKKASDLNG